MKQIEHNSMTPQRNIIEQFFNFFDLHGFETFHPLSLTDESFPTTYVPSAGEPHIVKILLSKEAERIYDFKVNQPCFRSVDIKNVGTDNSHLSFFEMLGAFSFIPVSGFTDKSDRAGQFSSKQLQYLETSFEFMHDILGLEKDRLWVTIFGGGRISDLNLYVGMDEVALSFLKDIGIPEKQIIIKGIPENYLIRMLKKPSQVTSSEAVIFGDTTHELSPNPDINFFSGKRIEVFYDTAPDKKCGRNECKPTFCDCQRFVEISTSAFLDKYLDVSKTSARLLDSPYHIFYNVYGFERLEMITRRYLSIFEIDVLRPLLETIKAIAQVSTFETHKGYANAISDFVRGFVFIVAAGGKPGARGRDFVLRSIIRKMFTYATIMELDPRNLFPEMITKVIQIYGKRYASLAHYEDLVKDLILMEWTSYRKVLMRGLSRLDNALNKKIVRNIKEADLKSLSSSYGIPLELISQKINEEKHNH
jgi:alanyl-tRNA synthetase